MLKLVLFFCVAVPLAFPSPVQASDDAAPEAFPVSAAGHSFDVQLTEYQFDQPLDPSVSNAEILEILAKPAAEAHYKVVTSHRLSVDNETEALVQIGQNVSLTTETTQTPRGMSRNMKNVSVGKLTRVTVASRDDGVLIQVDYAATGANVDRSEDRHPVISKTTVQITRAIELGRLALIGSSRNSVISVIVTAAQ